MCATVTVIKKDDQYYVQVLAFARKSLGCYKAVAKAIGAPSCPAVQAWLINGVAFRVRPALDKRFGAMYRKSVNEPAV